MKDWCFEHFVRTGIVITKFMQLASVLAKSVYSKAVKINKHV